MIRPTWLNYADADRRIEWREAQMSQIWSKFLVWTPFDPRRRTRIVWRQWETSFPFASYGFGLFILMRVALQSSKWHSIQLALVEGNNCSSTRFPSDRIMAGMPIRMRDTTRNRAQRRTKGWLTVPCSFISNNITTILSYSIIIRLCLCRRPDSFSTASTRVSDKKQHLYTIISHFSPSMSNNIHW